MRMSAVNNNSIFSVCNNLVLSTYFVIHIVIIICLILDATPALGTTDDTDIYYRDDEDLVPVYTGPIVDYRWPLDASSFGRIRAVKISDGGAACYYLHFITMNPGSFFLPVYLHSEMIFYVYTGSGVLNWMNAEIDDGQLQEVMLTQGDVYRLAVGTVFYIRSQLSPDKLRIHAIFPGSENQLHIHRLMEVYTGVNELLLGFDNTVLLASLNVAEGAIEELRHGQNQSLIVEGLTASKLIKKVGYRGLISAALNNGTISNNNKKKSIQRKAYNLITENHDVESNFGWSNTASGKDLDVLKNTNFVVVLVNLTKGSMLSPHLNPSRMEVGIVLDGEGVIHLACTGIYIPGATCRNTAIRVKQGDTFVVPRTYPTAHISFNNESFVFMMFTHTPKKESPLYLAGNTLSILQRLDTKVLEKTFKARSKTIDWVLLNEGNDTIYECVSCADKVVAKTAPKPPQTV